MKTQKRYAKALVRKISDTEGMLQGVIGSTATIDRYGESVDQGSWDLESFKKNPVILWAHNLSMNEDRPPIAKAVNVDVVDKELVFDIQFDMKDEFAASIYRKYKEGFLNAFSVGFISHSQGMMNDAPLLMDNELLELSAVPVPANPEALQALKARSFSVRSFKSLVDEVEKEAKDEADQAEKEDKKPADETPAPEIESIKDIVVDEPTPEAGTVEDGSAKRTDPENLSVGTKKRLVAVVREATMQLQAALAIVNAELRSSTNTREKGNNNQ